MQTQSSQKIVKWALIVIAIIILSGITLGYFYSKLPENNPQESKQGCESVGGDWSNEQNVCLVSYKKAGDICTDGGQCISGICSPPILTEEQKTALNNGPLKNITGTCSANEEPTGCVEQVIMGTVSMASMCLGK